MRVVPAVPPAVAGITAAAGGPAVAGIAGVAALAGVPPTVARSLAEFSFVAYPAPVVAPSALVAAFRTGPLVAWSTPASRAVPGKRPCGPRVIVGIGMAAEVRAEGSSRWREVIAKARTLVEGAEVVDLAGVGEHLTRARLLGGLAFAPGAADAAPWSGFGDAWFVLPRWTYVHDGIEGALIFARRGGEQVPGNELADLRVALATPFTSRPQPPMTAIDHGDRDAWRAQVRAITDAIGRGEYTKIVAARSAVVSLAGDARAADMLAELDERHPETVRLLVRPATSTNRHGSSSGAAAWTRADSSPSAGATFIAATPERLVRLGRGTAWVDALAGSRARSTEGAMLKDTATDSRTHSYGGQTTMVTSEDLDARELLASGKDRREHAIVVDAIVSALRALGADVRFPDAPTIRTLRHVLHLHTPITAEFSAARKHVLEVAEALHPTPAVGGTPTRAAMTWIAEREQVPRGWYSSPVGWFDADGNGEFAVAIRSGLLVPEDPYSPAHAGASRAHLWAGAGIVAGSDPDRELAETDLKLRAMLGALGVSA